MVEEDETDKGVLVIERFEQSVVDTKDWGFHHQRHG